MQRSTAAAALPAESLTPHRDVAMAGTDAVHENAVTHG